jgi:hypothetical protein
MTFTRLTNHQDCLSLYVDLDVLAYLVDACSGCQDVHHAPYEMSPGYRGLSAQGLVESELNMISPYGQAPP